MFTFLKKYGIDITGKYFIGLRIMLYSFLIGIIGVLIIALGSKTIGTYFVDVCMFGAVVGMVIHWAAFLEKRNKK